jgi:hypothetical protein
LWKSHFLDIDSGATVCCHSGLLLRVRLFGG